MSESSPQRSPAKRKLPRAKTKSAHDAGSARPSAPAASRAHKPAAPGPNRREQTAHTKPNREPLRLPSPDQAQQFADILLQYFARTARKLPWRDNPTGYGVWVSEMMLQQTQVATVLPYYQRWMNRFPTLESLAQAEQAEVLAMWQGLGYYARARALHAGAQHVLHAHDGQLPRTAHELRELPGIGPYTAGAIASIAFEEAAPIVDGNVIRVLCRVFGLAGSPMHQPLKGFLWQLAALLVPRDQARNFNQALMEFGALCCTPKSPLCRECPLRKQCSAQREGAVERYPELPERPKTTQVTNVAALVRHGSRVLVGQLPADAPRWSSMWQFPNVNLEQPETESEGLARALRSWCSTTAKVQTLQHTLEHSVTRYRITVHLYEVALNGAPRASYCQDLAWCDRHALQALPMPAAHRKLAERVLPE